MLSWWPPNLSIKNDAAKDIPLMYTVDLKHYSDCDRTMSKKSVMLPKLLEWGRRYLPAEIIGTCTALAGAFGAHAIRHSLADAAIAGSIAETLGFYSYFVVRDGAAYYRRHRHHSPFKRVVFTSMHTLRDILIEFGPAEAIDSLFFRPLCMYLGPQLLHNFGIGLLAGKLVADLIFYLVAACGYELKKYWHKRQKGPTTDD